MNRQRKVVITITYNEMGIIIDTKAEEVAQPNLQSTCNELATDCVSRQAAIDGVKTLHDVAWKNWHEPTLSANVVLDMIRELPSAQQKPLKYTGDSICLYCQTVNCDGCMYEPVMGVQ